MASACTLRGWSIHATASSVDNRWEDGLADVFAIEDEIAKGIAQVMREKRHSTFRHADAPAGRSGGARSLSARTGMANTGGEAGLTRPTPFGGRRCRSTPATPMPMPGLRTCS